MNLKEINAFALPGGPMFVNRGMFDAAASEGEVAGVMAHELSHVLLRHGTANASKAQNPWLQLGQLAGAIGGAVVGGPMGSTIAQGSQFGLGTLLLRYSRDYEKQADILGAQIMARAGYDPRALAHMFETIERQSGSGEGSPQWMNSHPNPGNRTLYINKEADLLTIAAVADSSEFQPIKTAFASLPPARSMSDARWPRRRSSAAAGNSGGGVYAGTPGQPVAPPSTQYRTISGGKVFQAVRSRRLESTSPRSSSIKVVPENAYGQLNGQTVFTCGVEFGIAQAASRDLQEATNAWLKAVAQGNPELRLAGPQQTLRVSQRSAIATPFANPSSLGGEERIVVTTMFLVDGTCSISDGREDADAFQEAFRRIGEATG